MYRNAGPRIGSLFTGTGALDLAAMDVYGGDVVWHSQYEPPDKNGREDKNQYAARILARHWPAVPNLGDITKICWQCVLDLYGRIDILLGGFPCTDVSSAGQRAGLTADSRSGLWAHMALAIRILRPRLVVIENVQGLLSAPADRGLGPNGTPLDEAAGTGELLRALGAVLGDLATLGFDAEWVRVAASEVGAPHGRNRIFILAWPAAVDADGSGRGRGPGFLGGLGLAERGPEAVADAADLGHERGGHARGRGDGPADGGVAAADAAGPGREGHPERHRGPDEGQPEREPGLDPVGRGVQRGAVEPLCPTCGCGEWLHDAGGFCAGCQRCTDPELGRPDETPPDTDRGGLGPDERDLRAGQPDVAWGDYEPAIRRWEHVLGRPAPRPTDALGRLSPAFTEWLMGLPAGWVTDTPGLTRPAMLKALGNGVVRLQASTAIRLLHERVAADLAALAAA